MKRSRAAPKNSKKEETSDDETKMFQRRKLLDVGSSSLESLYDSEVPDLNHSKQLLDWVISRKIFTESNDQFSLIFFGHEVTRNELLPQYSNIYIHNDEYAPAKVDCWRRLCFCPLCGLESLKVHAEDYGPKELTGLTVTLVTNFSGHNEDKDTVMEMVKPLAAGFKALGAQLLIIGPDLSAPAKTKSQEIGFEFVKALLPLVDGTAFSFRDGLSQLKFFIPKSTQPRGQPFDLELAKDFGIKVQMYVKNTEATMKISFNPVAASSSSTELKKVRRYETTGDEGISINYADIDNLADEEFAGGKRFAGQPSMPGAKFVDKDDVIKGYRYGKSLIPFGKAEQKLLEFPKDGKQLQLLQFTKLENILPHFLLNNCRYLLPLPNDETSQTAMSALVKAMLEQDVVALCRYAYNVNSNPRVACLIPKISKKSSLPILMHYTMPFNEDMRNYEFPALEKIGEEPSDYQLDLIDEYISSMLLANEDGSNEQMRCKQINNPKHQHQCQVLRQKAMHPGEPFPELDRAKLLEMLSPPKEMLEVAKDIIESAKEAFALERNPYTRVAAFSTKKLAKSVTQDTETQKQTVDSVKTEDNGKASPNWNADAENEMKEEDIKY
uniref:Ku domain-containing protein n=1 Tax=Ditylenchus dipsaci TaxID=166011 RepID=A0A915D472_9BILA